MIRRFNEHVQLPDLVRDRRRPNAGIKVPLRPLITVSRKLSSLSLVANRLGPRAPDDPWQTRHLLR